MKQTWFAFNWSCLFSLIKTIRCDCVACVNLAEHDFRQIFFEKVKSMMVVQKFSLPILLLILFESCVLIWHLFMLRHTYSFEYKTNIFCLCANNFVSDQIRVWHVLKCDIFQSNLLNQLKYAIFNSKMFLINVSTWSINDNLHALNDFQRFSAICHVWFDHTYYMEHLSDAMLDCDQLW